MSVYVGPERANLVSPQEIALQEVKLRKDILRGFQRGQRSEPPNFNDSEAAFGLLVHWLYGTKSTLGAPDKTVSFNNYPHLYVLTSKFLILAPSEYDPR